MMDVDWSHFQTGRRPLFVVSFLLVIAIIGGTLVGVYCGLLKVNEASLLVSSVLTVATFGYVLLTFSMASTMREEMEHSKELFKLRRKDDIVSIIKEEIRPIQQEIQSHRSQFNASSVARAYDSYPLDDRLVHRLPELDTEFDQPSEAANLSNEVNVDAGDVYSYFHKVNRYDEIHQRAVTDLSLALLENADELGINGDFAESYAKSALAIEPTGEVSRSLWDSAKEDVMPFRNEVKEITDELLQLKSEIKKEGRNLSQSLGMAESNLKQEYYITESDL